MVRAEAIQKLRNNQTAQLVLVTRDATGKWFDEHSVFLDDCGELRMSHPTNPKGDVAAPLDGDYRELPLDPNEE